MVDKTLDGTLEYNLDGALDVVPGAAAGPDGDGVLLNDDTSFVLLNDESYLLLNG